MSDRETLQGMADAGGEAHQLNELSQPLGYAVTFAAGGTLGAEGPTYRRLTVHRIDQPVASGPTFDTADEVRAFLDQLAQLPLWRLDLDDNSIEFDSEELTIRDKATGESFCLKGWSWGVTGRAARGQSAGRYEGATHLSVRSDESPSIGKWYKSDKG